MEFPRRLPESITVRPYRPADRNTLRRLCCDTADRGEPVEGFFNDREVFADLLTRYYTDAEPTTCWVAEQGGTLVGYLTGCLDTRRHARWLRWHVVPPVCAKLLWRGGLAWPQTWRLAWAALRTLSMSGWPRGAPLARYPAHLHVNIAQAFRHQAIGPALLAAFEAQARAAGVAGIHATVRMDNLAACRFFARMGFRELDRYHVVFPRGERLEPHDTVFYGKTL